jgi:CBS-domain-containing membrane protein
MSTQLLDDEALELDVRDVMTAGVVTVDDDATLEQAVEVMAAHHIHAVLVVGTRSGTALGWVTTRGLLAHVGSASTTRVTDAITEEARGIDPCANVRAGIYALGFPGVTRLLVRRRDCTEPEGVVTDYDLTVRAIQLSRRRVAPQAAA